MATQSSVFLRCTKTTDVQPCTSRLCSGAAPARRARPQLVHGAASCMPPPLDVMPVLRLHGVLRLFNRPHTEMARAAPVARLAALLAALLAVAARDQHAGRCARCRAGGRWRALLWTRQSWLSLAWLHNTTGPLLRACRFLQQVPPSCNNTESGRCVFFTSWLQQAALPVGQGHCRRHRRCHRFLPLPALPAILTSSACQ